MATADSRRERSDAPARGAVVTTVAVCACLVMHAALSIAQVTQSAAVGQVRPLDDSDGAVNVVALQVRYVAGDPVLLPVRTAVTGRGGEFHLHGLDRGTYVFAAYADRRDHASDGGFDALTFFPGVTDPEMAQEFQVGEEDLISGLSRTLVRGGGGCVTGVVLDTDSLPVSGAVIKAGSSTLGVDLGGAAVRSDEHGHFAVCNVNNGTYTVRAFAEKDGERLRGEARVALGATASEVAVVVHKKRLVQGIVSRDGKILSDSERMGLQIAIVNLAGAEATFVSSTSIGPGGQFEFWAFPGPSLVRVLGPVASWNIAKLDWGGTDVSDTTVDLSQAGDRRLEIGLTSETGSIDGNVTSSATSSEPLSAIVFADDPNLRGPASRYTRVARVNSDGAFAITGLLPGRYLVALVGHLESGQEWNQRFLEGLAWTAARVVIKGGQATSVRIMSADVDKSRR